MYVSDCKLSKLQKQQEITATKTAQIHGDVPGDVPADVPGDVQELIASCPDLPEHIKAAIMTLMDSARTSGRK